MPRVPESPQGPRPGKAGPPASGTAGRRTAPSVAKTAKTRSGAAGGGGASRKERGARTAPAAPPPQGRARPALTSRAAILALVVCAIALSLAYPMREYVLQRSEIAKLQEERERTQQNVDELQQRRDELQDPDQIEREARTRLHYQYPGERAYVIVSGEDREAERTVEPTAEPDPWFTRLWRSVQEADEAATGNEEIPEAQPPER